MCESWRKWPNYKCETEVEREGGEEEEECVFSREEGRKEGRKRGRNARLNRLWNFVISLVIFVFVN